MPRAETMHLDLHGILVVRGRMRASQHRSRYRAPTSMQKQSTHVSIVCSIECDWMHFPLLSVVLPGITIVKSQIATITPIDSCPPITAEGDDYFRSMALKHFADDTTICGRPKKENSG